MRLQIVVLFVALLAVCSDGNDKIPLLNAAQGLYHAFWAVLLEPKSSVLNMLSAVNKTFTVTIPHNVGIPADKAIIALEMGVEHNCGPVWPPFLRTNFGEFKFEIPWVNMNTSRGDTTLFTYKSLILQDNKAEVLGSEMLYDLNAHVAKIEMNSTSYMVDFNGKLMTAVFHNVSGHEIFQNASEYPYFDVYKQIASQTWYGKSDHICARHDYDFDHAIVRPVTMSLTASDGLFPAFNLSGEVVEKGIDYPLGVAEIWANFTISAPTSCHD